METGPLSACCLYSNVIICSSNHMARWPVANTENYTAVTSGMCGRGQSMGHVSMVLSNITVDVLARTSVYCRPFVFMPWMMFWYLICISTSLRLQPNKLQRHKFTWNCNKCAAVMFRQKVKVFLHLTAMVSNADKELRHGSYILNPYPANMENMVSS